MSYVFGIDLGTTYSCIAYIDEYGKPVVLKNSEGELITPSVVLVESEDNIVVGKQAKQSIDVESDKTVQFIKRKIGKENDTVILNGTTYHATEISAMILKKLVNDANEELRQTGVLDEDEEVKDVIITCPAYFGMNERQATKKAGELAGLNVLNIINEPTAAAISYGVSRNKEDETVLVYDLGGGTFDITVMNISGGDISVVCTGGDDQLGGKDWDEALMEYVTERYEEIFGEDLSEDPERIAALYVEVEKWKKTLTVRKEMKISVKGPAKQKLYEDLTREKYEELTSDLLNRTKNLLDKVLKTAEERGYPLSRIDKVLLVGGSSRMPQVAAMLKRDYHITPLLSDPDEAVAKGAAIYAGNEKAYNDFVQIEAHKTGKTVEEIKEQNLITGEMDRKFALSTGETAGGARKINIKNTLSRTYGVDVVDEAGNRYIVNMLMIHDTLPATTTKEFFSSVDGQGAVVIGIYESFSTDTYMSIEGRDPLTEIEMKFRKRVPLDTPIITTISLDDSGILHIMSEEQYGHTRLDTTFQLSNQMSEEDMRSAALRMNSANIE